jgi:hypothetical protein
LRIILAIVAALMVLTGLIWVGQGTGYIHWPANSFTIDERPWAIRGFGLTLMGIALFWFTRRR